MSVIHFALPILVPSVFGAAGVMAGNLLLDRGRTAEQTEFTSQYMGLGLITFVLGWLVVVAVASLRLQRVPGDDCLQLRFNLQSFLRVGIPALVAMAVSIYAQYTIPTGEGIDSVLNLPFLAFAATWLVFAVSIGYRDGSLHKHALVFSIPSAVAIIVSMYYLMSGTPAEAALYEYTPGVPLFVLGWLGIAFSLAATRVCTLCDKRLS